MTRMGVIKRLAFVTAVLFGAVSYVAFFKVQQGSFTNKLLDLRVLGYTPKEAVTFAGNLGAEARSAYLDVYLILDAGLILFLSALLYACATALRPRRFWQVAIGFTAIYALADFAENYLVAQLVMGASHGARLASWMTAIKFAALSLAFASLIQCWRQGRGSDDIHSRY